MSPTSSTVMRVWLDGVLLGDRSTTYGSNAWHGRSLDVTNAVAAGGHSHVYEIEWEWVGGNDGAHVRNMRIERDGTGDVWHDQYFPRWFNTSPSGVDASFTASDGLTPYTFPKQRNWEAADWHFFRNDATFQRQRNVHYVAIGAAVPKQTWPWWVRLDLSADVDDAAHTTTAAFWLDGTLLGEATAAAASPRRWYPHQLNTKSLYTAGAPATVTWQYRTGYDSSQVRNMRIEAGDDSGWRDSTRSTHHDQYYPQRWNGDVPVGVDGYGNARQLDHTGTYYDTGAHVDHSFGAPTSYPDTPSVGNLAPVAGAVSAMQTPTLSASFNDLNPDDDGYVEFEIYEGGTLVASNVAGPNTFVQAGQTSSWQVPDGKLQRGRTYTWRARAFDGIHYSEWTSTPADRPLSLGGASFDISQWSVDQESGRVDVSYRVGGSGLNAPGDIAGPCYQIHCYWRVESRHKNGSVEKSLGTLASGTLPSNSSSLSENVSGPLWMEVTDIRTIVEPGSCYGCSQARTHYDSGWVKVAEPYGTGDIFLTGKTWERDPASGVYTFDLEVSSRGAAQFGGPCAEKACQWRVDARYENGIVGSLGSEQLAMGTWSLDKSLSGTISGGKIIDLKATLASMCDVNLEYSCWDPHEIYTTGWRPVSDLTLADIDVEPLLGFVQGRGMSKLEFCVKADEVARTTGVPDATPSTGTTHSVGEACLGATGLRAAIKAMVAVGGGTVVIGAIIISLDGDNPNQDAIRKVPPPEADAAGSGVGLPPSCLDDPQKALLEQELEEGGWLQKHHAASDKHSFWSQAYKDLLAQRPWAANKTLGQEWNLMKRLPHRGNHPPAYHYWIYRNLEKALREATDWESFVALWQTWVTDVIRRDPTIVRWEWWRC